MNNEFNDKVRVQDDLYNYVNGKWIEKAKIRDDLPAAGGFFDLVVDVEKIMIKELKTLAKKEVKDPLLAKAVSLFKKVQDDESRSKGKEFLLKKIEYFESLKTKEEFLKAFYYLYDNNYPLPFNIGVTEDMSDATKYNLVVTSPSIILPDTTMYETEQGKALLTVYKDMALKLLARLNIANSEEIVAKTLSFDEKLSKIVKSQVEWADYIKCNNPYTFEDFGKLVDFDFNGFVISRFGKLPDKVVVYDPKFFENYKALMEGNYEEYKCWALVNLVKQNIEYLSEEDRNLAGIYGRALNGVKVMSPLDKYAYRIVNKYFGEVIGVYYGKKYFGEEAKQDVISIVKNLIESYKERLSKNTWLSENTIKKAILKLDTMKIKIGYPDKIDDKYYALTFSENASLVEVIDQLNKTISQYADEKLFKEVDHSVWVMSGNTVNACYNPSFNDITFPAAILQAPFYSIKQSVEENYGGIGCVIGHEISHAFDNNGAQMDEKGNINNWWTEEDYAHFKDKTEAMVNEFDGLELVGEKVNGRLTVSENIADNGGVTSSIQSLNRVKENPDFKPFFMNYARIWCVKQRPEYTKYLLKADVHGPCYYRANMQVRNFEEFYKAFDVKETDKMYLAPEKRVIIW